MRAWARAGLAAAAAAAAFQRDFDQPLDRIRGARELDAKAREDDETQHQLNEYDRGERISALPRPHHSFMLCISGHRSARLTPQR